jgi:hypothetical protein
VCLDLAAYLGSPASTVNVAMLLAVIGLSAFVPNSQWLV